MRTTCHYPTDVSEEQGEIRQRVLPKPTWYPGGPGREPLDPTVVRRALCQRAALSLRWCIQTERWRRLSSLRYDGRQHGGGPLRPALPAPPAVGIGQAGDHVRGTGLPDLGRVGIEDAIVVGLGV